MFGQPQWVARSSPASTSRSPTKLALHPRELALVRLAVRRLAAVQEVLARGLGELALPEGVVAAVPGLRDEVEPLGDLALGIPQLRAQLVGPRERVGARVLLEHRPLARARRRSRCSCGRWARRRAPARAPTRFCAPKALASSASSSGGLKSTTPATFTTASMVPFSSRTRVSSRPQSGRPMSPSMGSTFSRRKASNPIAMLLAQRRQRLRSSPTSAQKRDSGVPPCFGRTTR